MIDLLDKIPMRSQYTVEQFLEDLKKVEPTPGTVHRIGAELIYYEWTCCKRVRGEDDSLTKEFNELLDFFEEGYEEKLIKGELTENEETPTSVIDNLIDQLSSELANTTIGRSADYIYDLLVATHEARQDELEEYSKLEEVVRNEVEEHPEDPDAWNELRLVLWVLGKYDSAKKAMKNARKLGWDAETSEIVAL
ncbi:MAG: hypothetical protein GF309_02535 [Candidatus Lokiarchaeota archaeon]|nr:hypothetical protein [Candidatus Lokiarchaeota archaeon]